MRKWTIFYRTTGKERTFGNWIVSTDTWLPISAFSSVYWCAMDGKTHESGRPANSSQHYNSASWNVRSWPPFANDKDSLEDTNIIHGEYLQIMQGTGITLWDNQSYPHTPGQCSKRNHLCCLRLSLHIKLCYSYPDPSQCELNWASPKERGHS